MALEAVILRELKESARRKRTFWIRFLYGALLAAPVVITYPFMDVAQGGGGGLFEFFVFWQFALVLMLAPAAAVSSVGDERDSGTLGLILLTRLKPFGIVAGKLAVQFGGIMALLLSGLPILFFVTMLGGISPGQIFQSFLVIGAAALGASALGLAVATHYDRTYRAAVATYLILSLLVFGVPLLCQILMFFVPIPGPVLTLLYAISPGYLVWQVVTGGLRWSLLVAYLAVAAAGSAGLLFIAGRGLNRIVLPGVRRTSTIRWLRARAKARRRGEIKGNPIVWREARFRTIPYVVLLLILGVTLTWVHYVFGEQSLLATCQAMSAIGWLVLCLFLTVRGSLLFAQEMEGASLPLLLACPLKNRDIINGKALILVHEYWPYAVLLALLFLTGWIVPGYRGSMLGGASPASALFAMFGPLLTCFLIASVSLWSSLVSTSSTKAIMLSIFVLFAYFTVIRIIFELVLLPFGPFGHQLRGLADLLVGLAFYFWLRGQVRVYCSRA